MQEGTTLARNRGFSLIEVLVALVLAGGGIAGVVTAIGSTDHAEAKVLQAELMQRLAHQKLDELIATSDTNSQGGVFTTEGYPDYRWTLNNQTTSVTNLQALSVTVTKADDTKAQAVASLLNYSTAAVGTTGAAPR